MMAARQNILSTNMLKNVKISYKNVKSQLATPETCQARNLSSNSRMINCAVRGNWHSVTETSKLTYAHHLSKYFINVFVVTINQLTFIGILNDHKISSDNGLLPNNVRVLKYASK